MPAGFLDTSERAFDAALRVQRHHGVQPHPARRPGDARPRRAESVVNITSTAGRFAIRGMSAYGTAKAALIHLTRELAADLAPKIRVNAVSPGATATSALEIVTDSPELTDAMVAATPLKRLGQPSEIAAAALYLASPAAAIHHRRDPVGLGRHSGQQLSTSGSPTSSHPS